MQEHGDLGVEADRFEGFVHGLSDRPVGRGSVLYIPVMSSEEHVRAWRPQVPGVGEVLHAHFTEHAYPAHTHEHWTLLLVDSGGVAYDLDGRPQQAPPRSLTLLPPGVAARRPGGPPRRVRQASRLSRRAVAARTSSIGAAVTRPTIDDGALRAEVRRLHRPLGEPGEELEAESRLALICEALIGHLGRHGGAGRSAFATGSSGARAAR